MEQVSIPADEIDVVDKDDTDPQTDLSTINLSNEELIKERDKLKEQLVQKIAENRQLLQAIENLTCDSKITPGGIKAQLQKNRNEYDTQALMDKISSMQVIINQQKSQREEITEQIISDLAAVVLDRNETILKFDKHVSQHNNKILSLQAKIDDLELELFHKEEMCEQLLSSLDLQEKSDQQVTIERDGMALQLEEQAYEHSGIVAKLEDQILSMHVVNGDLQEIINDHNFSLSTLKIHITRLEQASQLHRDQEQGCLQEVEVHKQRLETEQQDLITCSICLSPWDECGDHRLVSLACGHLFGDSCIRSSLDGRPECPICRHAACMEDLRYIFGRHILPSKK